MRVGAATRDLAPRVTDVLGGWALGITCLGITAFAFELSRQASGAPVTDPVPRASTRGP